MTWASRSNRRRASSETTARPFWLAAGPNELDRGGSRQHPVPRPPHLAHAALPQLLLQPVAPQLARRGHLPAEPVDDPRTHVREPDREQGAERRIEVRPAIHRDLAGQIEHQQRQRSHRPRGERCHQHPARRAGQDEREQDDHHRHPGQAGDDALLQVGLPEGGQGNE